MPVDNEAIAKRVMYELLGRRWVWPAVSTTEVYEHAKQRIHLSGRPVISVESVKVNGTEVTGWRVESKAFIKLPRRHFPDLWAANGWYWSGASSLEDALLAESTRCEVEVSYTYGSPPPELVEKAINTLTCELDLAFTNPDECRLPSRVTSISRQGIDMTILDPMDFLEEGLTGIEEVDSVIRYFNPVKAKGRARVYSADYRPGRRLASGS